MSDDPKHSSSTADPNSDAGGQSAGVRRADDLVEQGLQRYGRGDLTGAMAEWEHALALRPTHELAREYIEYVKSNFDLLSAQLQRTPHGQESESTGANFHLDGGSKPRPLRVGQGAIDGGTGWTIGDECVTPLPPPPVGLASFEDLPEELGAVDDALIDLGSGRNLPHVLALDGEDELTVPGGSNEPIYLELPRLSEDAISGLDASPASRFPPPEDENDEDMTVEYGIVRAITKDMQERFPASVAFGEDSDLPELDGERTVERGAFSAVRSTDSSEPLDRDTTEQALDIEQLTPQDAALWIQAGLDANAPKDESPNERSRRRITGLIQAAVVADSEDKQERAVFLLGRALDEDPESVVAQKIIHSESEQIERLYKKLFGEMNQAPVSAIPLHSLSKHSMDSRVAFLLSRIDGSLSFDEILDISGMPKLETCRYLAEMLVKGILKVP